MVHEGCIPVNMLIITELCPLFKWMNIVAYEFYLSEVVFKKSKTKDCIERKSQTISHVEA